MQLELLTAPAREVMTVNQAKIHLCLTDDFVVSDPIIQDYINAAVSFLDGANGALGRGIITQTWTGTLDRFTDLIVLPLPPVISVDAIRYIDSAGNTQTLATSVYRTAYLAHDNARAVIERVSGQSWPTVDTVLGAVEIDFTVGYGATSSTVPEKIRQLVRFLLSDMFDRRETTIPSGVVENQIFTGMLNNAKFWSAV